jgi:hypothetical protein
MTKVSQAEFARLWKVSRKSVTKWKEQERIVMDGALVDVEASELRFKKYSSGRMKTVLPRASVNTDSASQVTTKPGARKSLGPWAEPEELHKGSGLPVYVEELAWTVDRGAEALMAILIADVVPREKIEKFVAGWVTLQQGTIADLLDRRIDPPFGCEQWGTHSYFTAEFPFEDAWDEMEEAAAESRK